MKAPETKSTHSQPPAAAEKAFFDKKEDGSFFSASSPEQTAFFQAGNSPTIQAKSAGGSQSFFQPTRIANIQAKCAECEAEEKQQEEAQGDLPEVQRMEAFGSDDEGETQNSIQRMPTFESDEAPVQAKLTVGQPGDKYEQEADAPADRVMAMSAPEVTEVDNPPNPLGIQRFSPVANDELQQQPDEEEETVQAKGQMGQAPAVTPSLEARLNINKGGGEPLSEKTRGFMEPRFGQDFSQVQVHADSYADEAAKSINAQAFTVGRNIAFRSGQYSPESQEGRRLLAHELTHVIQQQRHAELSDEIRMARNPDIVHGGFHTFYIGTSVNSRAMAMQIGQRQGQHRTTLTVASLTPGLQNPPLSARNMPLSIHTSVVRNPRILRETEHETAHVGHEKVIELELSSGTNVPTVVVVLRYSRSRQWVPYPSGTFGVWRRTMVESGWLQATDGYHQMTVNFVSETPGSFHSSRFRLRQHPRLGVGYLDTQDNRFYPYPRGRPTDADLMLVRMYIHMLPVVGPLVMIGEALVGRDIWGRRISTFERAILGGGALLSVIGPLLRAGAAATNLVRATYNLARVSSISRLQALQMIRGARNLTPIERTRLTQFSAKIRTGQALTQAEQTAANRILGKLAEPQRVVSIRAEVEALTGTASQAGRYTDLATQTSVVENRVGQALARDLRADVVRVPESTAQGTRVGDYIINNATAELYSPTTGSLRNLLSQAASKHKQAGILVIDVTRTSVPQAEVIGSAGRLFGRPEFADVSKIIYVHNNRVAQTVLRPVVTHSAVPGAAIRGGASAIGQQNPGGRE
ncbi:MAG: DUF4157 domain-containing protein [Leptolyngbyaceae cyanobacterium MO_188.B28]|nr:DUF4157 domain-containing protein [Leptolyngbyaceae cyanobacterium MO_188.B28]